MGEISIKSCEIGDFKDTEYAIYIHNLRKSYSKQGQPIIQNLCMHVKRGEIYGLLGESGCGKTTLLSLIVGLKQWKSGVLRVFGCTPGTRNSGVPGSIVGYMPQDMAMSSLLTLKELMQFYGKIYNMNNAKLTERCDFLTNLLDLPGICKPIGCMSGGQRRRASLALALLHSPKLLVLDEPTVGLDPLLRQKIWGYLHTLAKEQNTTILFTTHFSEEAQLSNAIGIMRNGRLLTEESPSNLLQRYGSKLFEHAVLQVCRQEESIKTWANPKEDFAFKISLNSPENFNKICPLQQEEKPEPNDLKLCNVAEHYRQTIQRILGLVVINLLPFKRYPLLLLIYLYLPAMEGVITLVCFASIPQGMKVGVVNNEISNWTHECNLINQSENICDLSALSCSYLNIVSSNGLISLKPFDTEEDAIREVHLGNIWGFITFPHNYSQHSVDFAAAKMFALNDSIEGSRIRVRLDHSAYPFSYYIVDHLMNSFSEYLNKLSISCPNWGTEAEYPLEFRTPVYGKDYMDNYIAFTMPGAIIFSFIFIVGVVTAVLIITDRNNGSLDRARVAGLTTFDIICGYLLTQAIIVFAQVIIWVGVLRLFFQFVILGSTLLHFLMCWISGLCGAALGILAGFVCKNEVEATVTGVVLAPFLLLYGGIFWPTEMMPWFWQQFGYFMPTSLPTMALRSVIIRGLGLTHALVWPGFLVIIAWTVGPIVCAMVAHKIACMQS